MNIVRIAARIRRHPWHGYAAASAIFIAALLVRKLFGQQDDPNIPFIPFITFFPAILLASLFGGAQAGIVIALLSGLSALYFFIPPYNSIALTWPWGYVVMSLFAFTSAVMIAAAHSLNRAMDDLARERDQSAVLFSELQHRVANNMQFVSALLSLQAKRLGADQNALVFHEARERFDAMSRVHRHLYDPQSLQNPMGEYLEKLCREMIDASGVKNIVCVVQIPEGIRLDVQRLLTMSLVITEVITNSLKHAFHDTEQGTISINLERENGGLALTVKDNGPGFASSAAPSKEKGLGMMVLHGFANQLGGKLTIDGSKGTTAKLVFPA